MNKTAQDICEKKYKDLFENIKSGVAVYEAVDGGKDFIFKEYNKAAEKINNIKRDELIGKSLLKVFPGVIEMGLFDIFQKVYKDGKKRYFPVHFYEDEKINQWVENTVYKLPTGEIVAIFDDLTQQKKKEEELVKSEERFSLAMKGSSDGLWDWDMETNEVYYSPRWKAMLGYKDSEIKNEFDSFVKLLSDEDRDKALAYVDSYVKSGGKGNFNMEIKMKHKNGKLVDILARSFMKTKDGKPVRMVGTHIDISSSKKLEEDLKSESEFNKTVINTAQAIILVLDKEANIEFFNKYTENLTGYKLKEMKGKDWISNFLPKTDFEKVRKVFKKALGKESTKGYVNPILDKKGKEILIEWYDETLRDKNGEIKGLLAVGYDVTERERIQKEIESNEKKYRNYVDNAPDGIFIANSEGKYIDVNPAACEITGYTKEELTKLSIPDMLPPEGMELGMQSVKTLKEKGEVVGVMPFIKKNREKGFWKVAAVEIEDHKMLGFVKDISKAKETEIKIKESEERYRNLFDNSQDAIMTMSPPDWKFSSGNRAAIKLFEAKDEKEFTKIGPWMISPKTQPNGEDSAKKAKEMIKKALKDGSNQFEWMHKTIKGKNFSAYVVLTKINNNGENIIQATVRDISQQKKAEAELREKLEDLEKMNRLMVGRELKMIELKEELNILKKENKYEV